MRLGAPCVAIAHQATTTTLVVTSLDDLNPTKGAVPLLVLNAIGTVSHVLQVKLQV